MGDLELVQRYAGQRDAEAFAVLVRRYQSAVWVVCRRACFEPGDVDDATQEVFLRLTENAGQLRGNVGAWLHRCAVNVAIDLNRKRARRRAHEANAISPAAGEDRQAALAEMREQVDAAMARLDEQQRELLVQRFYIGRPQIELAREMNVSPATMTRRIEQAIASLRKELESAGGLGAVAATGLLEDALQTATDGAAVPAQLTANVMKIGMSGAGAAGRGILAGWAVKTAAGLLLASGIGVAIVASMQVGNGGGDVLAQTTGNKQGVPTFVENVAQGPDKPGADWTTTRPAAENAVLAGRILDAAGKPVAGAAVKLTGNGRPEQTSTTDNNGEYFFQNVTASGEYRLGVRASGFVELRWYDGAAPKLQLTADRQMRRDIVIERGAIVEVTVIDEADQPIAQANLDVMSDQLPNPQPNWMQGTDAGGFTEYTLPFLKGVYRIDAVKKGYAPASASVQLESVDKVHEVTLVLKKGLTVNGTALCNDGSPAKGYEIGLQPEGWRGRMSTTSVPVDDAGNFTLPGVVPGRHSVHVRYGRMGQTLGMVDVAEGKPLRIDLPLGSLSDSKAVTGKVTFSGGKAPSYVHVSAYGRNLNNHMSAEYKQDQESGEGQYKFASMPADVYRIEFESQGFAYKVLDNVKIPGEIPTVQLAPASKPRIAGRVVDDVTGQPVEHYAVRLRKLRTIGDGPNYVQKSDWTQVSDGDGRFDIEVVGPGEYQVQASAEGYAWVFSERAEVREGSKAEVVVKLTQGGELAGRVIDSQGRPVAGAKVIPYSKASALEMSRAERFAGETGAAMTDAQGRFVLAHLAAGSEKLKVTHADFAPLEIKKLTVEEGKRMDAGDLRLLVGGSVEGRVYTKEGWPAAGVALELRDDVGYGDEDVVARVTTDENGFYSIKHLPEVDLYVDIADSWQREGVARRIVRPRDGRTAVMDMGGKRVITGVAKNSAGPLAATRLALAAGSPHFGQRAQATTDAHGRFAISGMPAGKYVLWHLVGSSDFARLAELEITESTSDLGTLTKEEGDVLVQLEAEEGVDLSTVRVSGMATGPNEEWSDERYRAQPVEGKAGHWKVSGVRAGPLTLSASTDWGSVSVSLERKAGVKETPVTIRIPAATGKAKVHFDEPVSPPYSPYGSLVSDTWPRLSVHPRADEKQGEVRLPPGIYRVTPGYRAVPPASAPRVEVKAGETTEIRMSSITGTTDRRFISVSVWSATGVPDLAARVRVTDSSGEVMEAKGADARGFHYELPIGKYQVIAEHNGAVVASTAIEPQSPRPDLPFEQQIERSSVRLYRE